MYSKSTHGTATNRKTLCLSDVAIAKVTAYQDHIEKLAGVRPAFSHAVNQMLTQASGDWSK